MAEGERISYSADDVRADVECQRRSLLVVFLVPVAAAGWAWLAYSASQQWELRIHGTATLGLWLGTYLAYKLNRRNHRLACWLLLLSLMLAFGLIVAAHPTSLAVASGVLVVVIANVLLGARAAFIAATSFSMATAAAWRIGTGTSARGSAAIVAVVLNYLAWGATCVASLPLKRSIESALAGWTHAREALKETRQRRAELYQTVRALEEATYRIQRMNNELLMARHEAEAARAAKARFVATVSHELRGPLNLILGFIRLIALSPEKYGQSLPTAYRADIDAIYRNSQHLVALVDDILDLSQIEAERLPLVKDFVDLKREIVSP